MVVATLLQSERWEAVDHALHIDWMAAFGSFFAWVLTLAVIYFLVRAVLSQNRYRAHHVLDSADVKILEKELHKAERKSVGEIVPVVLDRCDLYPQADWLAGLTFMVLGTAVMGSRLPWDQPTWVVIAQLLMGGIGFVCSRTLPDFKRLFISGQRATRAVEERAYREFFALGLHKVEGSAGVLMLVSLQERRVVVVGDEGIHSAVDLDHWAKTGHSILEGLRRHSLRIGLTEAIRRTAEVFAERFPWTDGERTEIPHRVVVRST